MIQGEPGDVAGELYMGYTVRSGAGWRYTEWRRFDNISGIADWSSAGLFGAELYRYAAHDENCRFDTDHVNVVSDPANAGVIAQHAQMLRSIV